MVASLFSQSVEHILCSTFPLAPASCSSLRPFGAKELILLLYPQCLAQASPKRHSVNVSFWFTCSRTQLCLIPPGEPLV